MFYRINIAGLERDLKICPLNENLSIAGFVMFGDVAITENLEAIFALAQDACIQESLYVYDCAIFELLQSGDVDGVQRLSKDVVEASLGDTTCQRHLAAFKSDADAAAGAGLLTLVTATCGLAVAGSVAAALALSNMSGAHCGGEFIEFHLQGPPYSSSVTWSR